MGFIKWHGEKEDHFEDVVEFAKENAKMEAENFGSQMKKKADAEYFCVPELKSMKTEDVLKLLIKEKKGLDILYITFVRAAENTLEHLCIDRKLTQQFYQDFLLYSVDSLFQQADMDEQRKIGLLDVILNKVFQINNKITVEEYSRRMKSSAEYQRYMSSGFELKSGNITLFWQWIRYISDLSAKQNEAKQFAKLYQKFLLHLAFYLNQVVANVRVGKRQAERQKINETIIKMSLETKVDCTKLKDAMKNPLFRLYEKEEEQKRMAEELARRMEEEARQRMEEEAERKLAELNAKAELRKQYIKLVKCARMILGYFIPEVEDDEDMVTAGRIYSYIRDKKIKLKKITSIMPSGTSELIENGTLPIILPEDINFHLHENELLHYADYAILYLQGNEEDEIQTAESMLYITDQRIRVEIGRNVYNIPYEKLVKVVMYDVMPGIIEVAGKEGTIFIQTYNSEMTYHLLKIIFDIVEEPEEKPMNMEEISIDFLENADLSSYIFGIKTMMDNDMPEKMQKDLSEVVRALGYLDIALQKYPSYKENTYNFFSYYIPEMVKVLYSYNEYEKAGIRELDINPVYEKVVEAVNKVSLAAIQKVVDIYKTAIVDTNARAQALAEILGQDGFVDPAYRIN